MALKFRCFNHRKTGQACYVPAGRYGNFLNSIKKLVSYVRYNIDRYYILHLTLTVAENVSEVDSRHLHRVIQFIHQRLKRADSDFKYVAVKEVQQRGAIHYHVLCIYSKPYVFPSSAEIARSWGLGFVKVTAPRVPVKLRAISNYIGKYIGKGYEFDALEARKSFTASQIPSMYKLNSKRLQELVQRWGVYSARHFHCTYTKVYHITKYTKKLVMEWVSEWEYDGIVGEPF